MAKLEKRQVKDQAKAVEESMKCTLQQLEEEKEQSRLV